VTIRKGKAASVVSGGRSKTDLLGGKIFQKHKAPRVNAQVILIVSPIFGRPGFFRAIIGNREIVAASRQPFLDGARALIRSGTDPATTIVGLDFGAVKPGALPLRERLLAEREGAAAA
jgi:hypothetical protein